MLMLAIALYRAATRPAVSAALNWLFKVVRRTLAASLNIPDAVLANTCAFAIAYLETAEQRATLVCPLKLWRAMRDRKLNSE